VYLSFIPADIKNILAQCIGIGAFILAIYFAIRFILGFFVDKREKESDELKALKELGEKIDKLSEPKNGDESDIDLWRNP